MRIEAEEKLRQIEKKLKISENLLKM